MQNSGYKVVGQKDIRLIGKELQAIYEGLEKEDEILEVECTHPCKGKRNV